MLQKFRRTKKARYTLGTRVGAGGHETKEEEITRETRHAASLVFKEEERATMSQTRQAIALSGSIDDAEIRK